MQRPAVEGVGPGQTTAHQRMLVTRWVMGAARVDARDWPELLAAFDQLHSGTLLWQGEHLTFAALHERAIEQPLGQPLLEDLVHLSVPEREGTPRLGSFYRQVRERLMALGLDSDEKGTLYLLAYSIYWARAFAQGYLYEVATYADLRKAGIAFQAHDLLDPASRRSPFDLVVSGWRGECKSSTYFLHAARSFPLNFDFCLTRWFDPTQRTWHGAAVLQPEVWSVLDGEPRIAEIAEVPNVFPSPAQITTRDGPLVAVPYTTWKSRVTAHQAANKEAHDGSIDAR